MSDGDKVEEGTEPQIGKQSSVEEGTRKATLNKAIQQLERADISDARRNAEWLLMDVLDCNRAALYAHLDQEIPPEQQQTFERMVARRVEHEPLQYILGWTDFYGLSLEVTPDVLIPRPETEEVVEHALRLIEDISRPNILDVGTGSGCIALAIKKERPEAEVAACDVSESALTVARRNADRVNLEVAFMQADVLAGDFAKQVPDGLDLLISNPPYIPDREADTLPAEVRNYEPEQALLTGNDPLVFYRALATQADSLLVPGGWFVVETHARFAGHVRALVQEIQFENHRVEQDLAGRARMVAAQRPTHPNSGTPMSRYPKMS